MLINIFCDKYEITKDQLYMAKSANIIPACAFYKEIHGVTHIDESYILRRREFKRKAILYMQDIYYLLAEHFSDTDIITIVSSAYKVNAGSLAVFLSDRLFRLDDMNILKYKLTKQQWVFYRFSKAFMHRLSKRAGCKININKILDRRIT